MIELSIGILILAICILLFSEKENKKRIQKSYEEGFVAGVEAVINRVRDNQMKENELEMKKD